MAAGLVVFDLDGTLLRGRTVCEVLADALGHGEEMRRFEALTAEADIAAARTEMARWYGAVERPRLLAFLDGAAWAPGAHEGVARLRAAGATVAIASITCSFAVERFAAILGIDRSIGTILGADVVLEHVWPRHKAPWLRALADELGVAIERTAAVGDSSGDVEMLQASACGVFVGEVRPAEWRGLHMPGADIRDVADQILRTWG